MRKRKRNKIKIKFILIIFFFIIAISVIFFLYKIFRNDKISTFSINKFIRKKNDNTWLLYNTTEIIDTYMNLIPTQYNQIRKDYENKIQDIALLKVYSEDDEKNLKLLSDKFSEKFKKNINLVKNIFVTKTGGLGNQLCALNNIIFYSEILGIKNIYLNDAYNNWYIKNKIITGKINISLANQNQINYFLKILFADIFFTIFFFL